MPSSTKPFPTVSNPTYVNFSASSSELNKTFDGLDQSYKHGEYYNILRHLLHSH